MIDPKSQEPDKPSLLARVFTTEKSQQSLLRRAGNPLPKFQAASDRSESDFTVLPSGLITPSKTFEIRAAQFVTQGSVPPTTSTSGAFAYTTGGTNIHWYWDGTNGSKRIVQRRADGSKFPIPAGDINITGLIALTTYYFYPFWPTYGQCQIGWVVGNAGADPNKIAFTAPTDDALQQQNLKDREALTAGPMTAATNAASPPPPGGGWGSCVMTGTNIEPLGDSDYSVIIQPNANWIRLATQGGLTLNCTASHPVFAEHCGKIDAGKVSLGMELITINGMDKLTCAEPFIRSCTLRKVNMKHGHLYWANGILSHNQKMAPP